MTLLTFEPSSPPDRAEQAIPLALELVDAVRCRRGADVQSVLDRADVPALLVVLAAMVDDERPLTDLLAWIDDGPAPRRRLRGRVLKPCGTHAAYNRHLDRGEPIDELCEAGERRYQRERARNRRAAQQREPVAV